MAVCEGSGNWLYDLKSGKEARRFQGLHDYGLAVSPNGKLLATIGAKEKTEFGITAEKAVRVWDIASNRLLFQLNLPADSYGFRDTPGCPVFSPDSRMLATGDLNGTPRLWEVATGKERRAFHGHRGAIQALAFSPDGRMLASGSADTTALLWDVTGRAAAESSGAVPAARLASLWRDLASEDAAKAFDAVTVLVGAPEQAVPMFNDKLKPAPHFADRKQIEHLIADGAEIAQPFWRSGLCAQVLQQFFDALVCLQGQLIFQCLVQGWLSPFAQLPQRFYGSLSDLELLAAKVDGGQASPG